MLFADARLSKDQIRVWTTNTVTSVRAGLFTESATRFSATLTPVILRLAAEYLEAYDKKYSTAQCREGQ